MGRKQTPETRARISAALLGHKVTQEAREKMRVAALGNQNGSTSNLIHGMKGTRTYVSWFDMKQRCLNPRSKDYPNYGGRGITVCAQWLTFEGFYADMGERPEDKTLDRINVDGDYESSNVRWATRSEQERNKRKKETKG